MNIEIRVKPKLGSRVNSARLKRIAQKTLRGERVNAELTIYVTDDKEIRALNRSFHATDAPTDVLSFPMGGRLMKRPYLGDIVISYDRARIQARAVHWRIADELDLLAAHGVLHLLGYDDLTPRKRAKMWKRQKKILGYVANDE